MSYTRPTGYTIIELLVIIVVIGILASITLVSYRAIQERSQASAISDGLRKVNQSLNIWATQTNMATWPLDPVSGGGTPLSSLIASNPALKDVLQQVPNVKGIHTEEWFYDNEGDSRISCGDPYDGVNIVIRFVDNANVAKLVDQTLDDGDVNCGTVRYADQRIFYSISYGQVVK